jgi:hypothetical protein
MRKISLAAVIMLATGFASAQQNTISRDFDAKAFEKLLPAGWHTNTIRGRPTPPYGFVVPNVDGLEIFLTGPTDVHEKGNLITKESLSIWVTPLSYSVKRVPDPGTPEPPARLIGTNQNAMVFALAWHAVPSWKDWEKDLTSFFHTQPVWPTYLPTTPTNGPPPGVIVVSPDLHSNAAPAPGR